MRALSLVLVVGALGLFVWRKYERDQCEQALVRAADARKTAQWDRAREALEVRPACAAGDAGRLEHARWLLAQARVSAAEAAFAEESKRQPQVAEVWASLGYTLALSGKDRPAIEALEHADALEPNNPAVTQHLADVRARQTATAARANASPPAGSPSALPTSTPIVR